MQELGVGEQEMATIGTVGPASTNTKLAGKVGRRNAELLYEVVVVVNLNVVCRGRLLLECRCRC